MDNGQQSTAMAAPLLRSLQPNRNESSRRWGPRLPAMKSMRAMENPVQFAARRLWIGANGQTSKGKRKSNRKNKRISKSKGKGKGKHKCGAGKWGIKGGAMRTMKDWPSCPRRIMSKGKSTSTSTSKGKSKRTGKTGERGGEDGANNDDDNDDKGDKTPGRSEGPQVFTPDNILDLIRGGRLPPAAETRGRPDPESAPHPRRPSTEPPPSSPPSSQIKVYARDLARMSRVSQSSKTLAETLAALRHPEDFGHRDSDFPEAFKSMQESLMSSRMEEEYYSSERSDEDAAFKSMLSSAPSVNTEKTDSMEWGDEDQGQVLPSPLAAEQIEAPAPARSECQASSKRTPREVQRWFRPREELQRRSSAAAAAEDVEAPVPARLEGHECRVSSKRSSAGAQRSFRPREELRRRSSTAAVSFLDDPSVDGALVGDDDGSGAVPVKRSDELLDGPLDPKAVRYPDYYADEQEMRLWEDDSVEFNGRRHEEDKPQEEGGGPQPDDEPLDALAALVAQHVDAQRKEEEVKFVPGAEADFENSDLYIEGLPGDDDVSLMTRGTLDTIATVTNHKPRKRRHMPAVGRRSRAALGQQLSLASHQIREPVVPFWVRKRAGVVDLGRGAGPSSSPRLRALREAVDRCREAGDDVCAVDAATRALASDVGEDASASEELVGFCLATLWVLAHKGDGNKHAIASDPAALDGIVLEMHIHGRGSAEVPMTACGLLWSLSVVPDVRRIVVENGGCEAVLDAVSVFPDDADLQATALGALKVLSFDSVGRSALRTRGAASVVAGAMEAHAVSAVVQSEGCVALGNVAVDAASQRVVPVGKKEVDVIVRGIINHPDALEVCEAACFALVILASAAENVDLMHRNEMIREALELAFRKHPDDVGIYILHLCRTLTI